MDAEVPSKLLLLFHAYKMKQLNILELTPRDYRVLMAFSAAYDDGIELMRWVKTKSGGRRVKTFSGDIPARFERK